MNKVYSHDFSSDATIIYYSTITSFYHIWSRERAKYETVLHCRTEQIRTVFDERNCFQHDTFGWLSVPFTSFASALKDR